MTALTGLTHASVRDPGVGAAIAVAESTGRGAVRISLLSLNSFADVTLTSFLIPASPFLICCPGFHYIFCVDNVKICDTMNGKWSNSHF